MSDLNIGVVVGILIGALATYLTYGLALRGDLAMFRRGWREAGHDRNKWRREAMRLANDDTYRGLHGAVVLVESKLGIEPSRTLTVWERWEKLSGRIDPHMLKVLLRPESRRADSPLRQRDAKRMLALRRLIEHPTTTGTERANAERLLGRLVTKYGDETMLT